MKLPKVVVVSGHPASGKSTLAKQLSHELSRPLVARDTIKEGLMQACVEASESIDWNKKANDAFAKIVVSHLGLRVNLVVEAAFQNTLWQTFLQPWMELADIQIVECRAAEQTIVERFERRLLSDEKRVEFHDDEEFLARLKVEGVKFETIVWQPEPIVYDTDKSADLSALVSKFL